MRDGECFCAVEPKASRHFTFARPNRSGSEFAQVVFELAMVYPQAKTIHLVLGNLNIHWRKSLTDLLGLQTGCEVWVNQRLPQAHRGHSANEHSQSPQPSHPR